MFKRLKVIVLVSILYSFIYGMPTVLADTIYDNDPCSELTGVWNGYWSWDRGCRFAIDINASNYKDNVQLAVQFNNVKGNNCTEPFSSTVTGVCKDGKLDVVLHTTHVGKQRALVDIKMTGLVSKNMLTLEYAKANAYAIKKHD